MPKTTPAPLAAGITQQIEALARQAEQGLAALDQRIAELRGRHEALTRHVSAHDAAAAIVADIQASIQRDYERIIAAAQPAAFLKQHAPHRRVMAINGAGQYEIHTSTPAPRLGILDNRPPGALFAALIEPGRLEAWALGLARAAGCPDEAPPPADIAQQADALMAELENLLAERADAAAAFEGLLGESAHVAEIAAAVRRMHAPLAEGKPDEPSSTRPAGVYDADGKPLSAIGSDGWREAMEYRRRAAELQAAAEIGTPDGLLAAADRRDDAGLRHGLN